MEWPKEVMLVSAAIPALVGGSAAYKIGLYSFISDISPPEQVLILLLYLETSIIDNNEQRSVRMGFIHVAQAMARPFATPFGAYLFETGGYLCVMTTSATGMAMGTIILYFRMKRYKWQPDKEV